ncbi:MULTISPECIES: class I SAM-dependent methyltransferase [unclassified Roseofilum]|uniref:class I SAM-dependent methyltransferase n=1 Tax=unclassified Roseofilum TaxID=2620099 RepID=UPI000E968B6A|nr:MULTISPECIES: class I SAM-dependent methyltransferase [unclassified Roseofilum]HBR00168.1 class I SAM-dependent methyltransferase [Cyanobacteria bacterium UBA11691]MBP0007657.1 class I SAM-dependent methyltransferase [Roseofilum sp. Belize Diploria]MBP0011799.1 class I SAM-dependent methyltransferase [Roseofilum sp. SID3]MBP0023300.1 class I SAM-dependent methyltransferase [Roseofilum sp. SID2]MBP0033539.1 class I SAM-dependent methyltransferase [Roseofilum sp. Belize BBD 4]
MSQSQLQLAGVPRTMVLTTRARADEDRNSNGLFRDRHAREWSDHLGWNVELDSFYGTYTQAGWAIRAEHFDCAVQRNIAHIKNPLVIELGAGLSSRYYRLQQENLHWINLDLPEVNDIRSQLDRETENYKFIGASALDFNWMEQLPSRSPEEIVIVAEGLLMYFDAESVAQLISRMQQRFPGATFIFDIVGTSYRKSAKKLEALGAPLQWFVKDIDEVARMGVEIIEVQSLFQLHPERWGMMRLLTWLPFIRSMTLIFETKLKP